MHDCDECTFTIWNVGGKQHIGGGRLASNAIDEIVEPLARMGREQNSFRITTTETQSIDAIEKIDFIEHRKRQTLAGTDLVKNAIDRLELALVVFVRRIYDFEN